MAAGQVAVEEQVAEGQVAVEQVVEEQAAVEVEQVVAVQAAVEQVAAWQAAAEQVGPFRHGNPGNPRIPGKEGGKKGSSVLPAGRCLPWFVSEH